MIKYSLPLVLSAFTMLVLSCNSQTKSETEASVGQPLAVVDIPAEVIPEQSPIAGFETVVLEADLPSPRKEMSGYIEEAKIKVNYGSPSVKGRDVWNALVPFGKVWRTGANEATTITVDQTIKIGGQALEAGTYGLFTLPTKGTWELIINKTAEQWGAYEYDDSKDVLRVTVNPQKTTSSSETLEFAIQENQLVILWEKLKIPVSLSTL